MEENIIVAKILEDLVPKMMTQMTGHLIPLKKYYDLAGDMFKQVKGFSKSFRGDVDNWFEEVFWITTLWIWWISVLWIIYVIDFRFQMN